jgi:hypothetical protein|tara:strand:+ start:1087 stop:1203 length:117 start_codon:yes stop_codon:yes gene_type:complete
MELNDEYDRLGRIISAQERREKFEVYVLALLVFLVLFV